MTKRKKKKTLREKIQKEFNKLESLHEKEEDVMEAINELLEDEDEDDEEERNSYLSGQYMSDWDKLRSVPLRKKYDSIMDKYKGGSIPMPKPIQLKLDKLNRLINKVTDKEFGIVSKKKTKKNKGFIV